MELLVFRWNASKAPRIPAVRGLCSPQTCEAVWHANGDDHSLIHIPFGNCRPVDGFINPTPINRSKPQWNNTFDWKRRLEEEDEAGLTVTGKNKSLMLLSDSHYVIERSIAKDIKSKSKPNLCCISRNGQSGLLSLFRDVIEILHFLRYPDFIRLQCCELA